MSRHESRKTYVITDQGDSPSMLWESTSEEKALAEASEYMQWNPDELQAWLLDEYYKRVLNRPWWMIDRDLWNEARRLGLV
jgi:hypothetical protein